MSYNDDLIIYKKIETLLDTIYPRIVKFPNYEKFRLAEYITLNIFELMKCVSLANSVKSKRLSYLQEAESMLNSWMGHAGHANSHNFIKSLFEKNGFIYMNRKGTIKIDTTKLGVVT
jgi:hypothetical protein